MTALLKPTRLRPAPVLVPAPAPVPFLLTFILGARRVLVALVVVGLVVLAGGYWWTVQTQQHWAESYQQLQRLTQHTRDLEWATAALEGQITPAQPGGLVPPRPEQLLVLPQASPRLTTPLPAAPVTLVALPLAY
ncbi:hypothetical protein [Candidatus Cyanaurora vandensis]|uniref:hypothetical protein n=1 Tax=Candidatus Cyanaurora vandensis TaxID=2714958 RepID=UPI00257C9AFD|nr:hypothetical protein [Candidatus Cyanaurora vandensis]